MTRLIDTDNTCKHCGRMIYHSGAAYLHVNDRGQLTLMRCNPDESGLPYGYDAEPVGAPCEYPCLGGRPSDKDNPADDQSH